MRHTHRRIPQSEGIIMRLLVLYKQGVFTLIQVEEELETARWLFHSPTALQAWVRTLQKPQQTEEGNLSPGET